MMSCCISVGFSMMLGPKSVRGGQALSNLCPKFRLVYMFRT